MATQNTESYFEWVSKGENYRGLYKTLGIPEDDLKMICLKSSQVAQNSRKYCWKIASNAGSF